MRLLFFLMDRIEEVCDEEFQLNSSRQRVRWKRTRLNVSAKGRRMSKRAAIGAAT